MTGTNIANSSDLWFKSIHFMIESLEHTIQFSTLRLLESKIKDSFL